MTQLIINVGVVCLFAVDNSSRVKLPKVAGENGSDYINATYLHGHFQNKEYIITQHPSANTEYDFWRMVWDQVINLL